MGPCIIMLKHEVMAVDEWHDNGPQDLVTVSLCIQIAIDKMQLCMLSIANVFSSMPVAIKGEHLPSESGYDAKLKSGQDPGEDEEPPDELP